MLLSNNHPPCHCSPERCRPGYPCAQVQYAHFWLLDFVGHGTLTYTSRQPPPPGEHPVITEERLTGTVQVLQPPPPLARLIHGQTTPEDSRCFLYIYNGKTTSLKCRIYSIVSHLLHNHKTIPFRFNMSGQPQSWRGYPPYQVSLLDGIIIAPSPPKSKRNTYYVRL